MSSPPSVDPYLALGIPRYSHLATIRNALRNAQQAYEILTDPTKRDECDHDLKLNELRDALVTKDPYLVLNVPTDADSNTIHGAHQLLVSQLQPQVVQGDYPARISAVVGLRNARRAYQILSNSKKRAAYDDWVKLTLWLMVDLNEEEEDE